jgi:thiol:disulfide interchange protein
MIRMITALLFIFATLTKIKAQSENTNLYNPEANAMEQLDQAILQAGAERKHVLIEIGGNWCPWCIKLHQFIDQHHSLDSLILTDYVLIHINYSKENKNPEAMRRLQFPQRFGFPVLVVLNAKGERLHTQNTAYLEEGESYNEQKIAGFLKDWNRKAIDPEMYLSK